jgi:hypothetical protein
MTGAVNEFPATAANGKTSLSFNLPPAGSMLLYVFSQPQTGFAPAPTVHTYAPMTATAATTVKPDEANTLTIDFCDLTLNGATTPDMHLYAAAEKVYKTHGFELGNPWNTSVQYKDHTVKRDTFKTGGFAATYKFSVGAKFDYSDMTAVVERPELYRISVNGTEVKPEAGQWWLMHETGVVKIGQYVKQGVNTITMENKPFRVLAEIEQVFIRGNFTVEPSEKGFTLMPPAKTFDLGSWKAQGFPFYGETVSYTKQVNADNADLAYRVSLGKWNGTVAEVLVNGASAGIIGWEPFELDIPAGMLRKGVNDVTVKVTGSNRNLLGPFHHRTVGLTSPWDFRNVKGYPAGKDYFQLDYGLMDDFTVSQAIK